MKFPNIRTNMRAFRASTEVKDKCVDGSDSSGVDGVVFGVEVIVHNRGDQDVDHLGQVVFHEVDDFLQRLQGVQVDLGVGLLQPGLEGIEQLDRGLRHGLHLTSESDQRSD